MLSVFWIVLDKSRTHSIRLFLASAPSLSMSAVLRRGLMHLTSCSSYSSSPGLISHRGLSRGIIIVPLLFLLPSFGRRNRGDVVVVAVLSSEDRSGEDKGERSPLAPLTLGRVVVIWGGSLRDGMPDVVSVLAVVEGDVMLGSDRSMRSAYCFLSFFLSLSSFQSFLCSFGSAGAATAATGCMWWAAMLVWCRCIHGQVEEQD